VKKFCGVGHKPVSVVAIKIKIEGPGTVNYQLRPFS
jgi:hypothetical protein